ncbi:hypothetical protein FBU30_009836 [Linnemannia zychae]|nr:hypothetical protein FBU30_009836 [Linnemannia zychae]
MRQLSFVRQFRQYGATLKLYNWVKRTHSRKTYPIVLTAEFSPYDKQVASGGHNGTVILRELETEAHTMLFSDDKESIYGIVYSPDGMSNACASLHGAIRIFDIRIKQAKIAVECKIIHCFVYSPDGKWIVSGHENGEMWIWESNTGKPSQHWKATLMSSPLSQSNSSSSSLSNPSDANEQPETNFHEEIIAAVSRRMFIGIETPDTSRRVFLDFESADLKGIFKDWADQK